VAKLVGAKCPNCGAGIRIDRDQEWVTCSFCNTSSFIETPARRNAPNHPPAHIPVIRLKAAASKMVALVVVLTVLPMVVGGAVCAGVAVWGASSRQTPRPVPQQGSPRPEPPRATPAPAVAVDFFADASSVPKAFQNALGAPPKAKELVIYPGYAILEAQDPRKPENVDRYTLRNGTVGDKSPQRLVGSEKAKLQSHLFELASVDFGLVPRLVADARTRLGYEGAKTSHVILGRNIPFSANVRWRVYVSSERDSGSVEYDAAGAMKRVFK
jgi:hypothetical protein